MADKEFIAYDRVIYDSFDENILYITHKTLLPWLL